MNHAPYLPEDVLIGIDVGSTNIRCVAYTTTATMIFKAVRATRQARQQRVFFGKSRTVLEPEIMWQLVCEACQETSRFLNARNFAVRGIAVSCMGGPAICLDDQNRVLFSIFEDLETPELLTHYQNEIGPERYFAITGYPLELHTIAFTLAAFQELDPEKYAAIATVVSVAGFINLKLTGKRHHEYSTSGATALWDQRHSDWWEALLKDLALTPEQLGQPVWSGDRIGPLTPEAAECTGFSDIDVYAGGHDYLCAALAAGCGAPETILNVNGTFEIVAAFHDVPQNRPEIARYRAMIDHHVMPNRYSLMMEAVGGGQIEWVKHWLPVQDWQQFLESLDACACQRTSPRELFIPHIYGRFFPDRRTDARGGYIGLSDKTDTGTLFLATLEGLCFQARQIFQCLQGLSGLSEKQPPWKIFEVGGASGNPTWMQMKADILGQTLLVPHLQEASALGAALLAGVGAEIYPDHQSAGQIAGRLGHEIYEPDPGRHAMYTEIFHNAYLPALEISMRVALAMAESRSRISCTPRITGGKIGL